MTERFGRQTDLLNMDLCHKPITVIGAGAIGSFTVLSLAKMGFDNLTVWDDDEVNEHNLPNQFFREKDIGELKVNALKDIVKEFTGVDINAEPSKYTSGPLTEIVISAVDSMTARYSIWSVLKHNRKVDFYVDARMGGREAMLVTVHPLDEDECDEYETYLYPSSEAIQERCTAKSIMFTVLGISSQIAKTVRNSVMNETTQAMESWSFH